MITQAKKFNLNTALGYELQAIIGFESIEPEWYEVLYRPEGMEQADHFFKNLTQIEKIEFDTELFSQLPLLQDKFNHNNLSVNLSPLSLGDEGFLNLFDQMLSYQGINCTKICIEVTETDPLATLSPLAIDVLKHFKQLGGQLALDDFGTGFSHWELIKLHLIDIIKVASQKIPNKSNNALLKASAKFIKELELTSVLEGVETEEDLTVAKKLGFDFCQGWLFDQWKLKA